jgi:hypothetical protein
MSKKDEIIKELNELGVEFDKSWHWKKLEKLLADAKASAQTANTLHNAASDIVEAQTKTANKELKELISRSQSQPITLIEPDGIFLPYSATPQDAANYINTWLDKQGDSQDILKAKHLVTHSFGKL